MRSREMVVLGLAALLLAGCENEAASWQAGGDSADALTLIREQRWFWDATSQVAVVVARYPDCQRRHALPPAPVGQAPAEVRRAGDGRYLIGMQGKWFAAETQGCTLQPVEAPDAQAAAVGAFDLRDGRLRFVPAG